GPGWAWATSGGGSRASMHSKRRLESFSRSARRASGSLPCSASASGTAGRTWAGMARRLTMQILITDSSLVRSRALHIRRWHAVLGALLVAGVLMAISGLMYHFVFITAAREGWPVASQLIKVMVRDELAQRERVMRENLDAIALRVGEMQAK